MKPLLQRIERGEIDPTRIITHTLPLDEAEHGFEIFKNKQDNCEKVVLKPMAPGLPSSRGEFHPPALTEPCVTVSRYTALVALFVRSARRWSAE
jgi:hypothetical protein